jgi:hypothetical protein
MYRNYQQLRDGWTKNLALLFPHPGRLAAKTLVLWVIPWMVLPLAHTGHWWWDVIGTFGFVRNTGRLRRANFDLAMEFLGALFGMPMFAYLLLRSKRAHAAGSVRWKDRTYSGKADADGIVSNRPQSDKTALATGH